MKSMCVCNQIWGYMSCEIPVEMLLSLIKQGAQQSRATFVWVAFPCSVKRYLEAAICPTREGTAPEVVWLKLHLCPSGLNQIFKRMFLANNTWLFFVNQFVWCWSSLNTSHFCPGQVAQLVVVSSCTPKRLWVQSPVRACTGGNQSMFSLSHVSLSLSLSLSLPPPPPLSLRFPLQKSVNISLGEDFY